MRHRTPISRPLAALAVSSGAFAITLISGPWVLRFAFDPLNYWFTGLSAMAVPGSLVWLASTTPALPRRAVTYAVAGLMALPLVPFGLLAISDGSRLEAGTDPSHRQLDEVSSSNTTFRLYQTDCGATCAYGLELRKEIDVLGVFKLVSPVWSAYREEPAALQLSPEGAVQVVRGEYVMHAHSE